MTKIRLERAIKERPIEIIASLIMIGLGIFLALGTQDVKIITTGSVLSTVGGVLLSWATATVADRDQASEVLRPQLEATSRHLGSISSQLAKTVGAVNAGQIDSQTGFALVSQANKTLYNLVTDIQILAGTPFDARGLLQTIDQLDGLASRLSDFSDELDEGDSTETQGVPNEIASELQSLRFQLSAFVAQQSTKRSTNQASNVHCPYCDTLVNIVMPTAAGSTEVKECPNCSRNFNAHRKSDGSVFTRKMGIHNQDHTLQPQNPYIRILHDQGIRLVPPSWRPVALQTLVSVFEDSPERRVDSFQDLEMRISQKLISAGESSNSTDVKKIRLLAYRAKVFVLLGAEDGISLLENITQENIDITVVKNLIVRISSFLGTNLDVVRLNSLFYDGKPEKLDLIINIVRDVANPQPFVAIGTDNSL